MTEENQETKLETLETLNYRMANFACPHCGQPMGVMWPTPFGEADASSVRIAHLPEPKTCEALLERMPFGLAALVRVDGFVVRGESAPDDLVERILPGARLWKNREKT